jgi:hypothetical protein
MKQKKQNQIIDCNHCVLNLYVLDNTQPQAVGVCTNPECPNYGLLQISIQGMKKLEWK